MGLRAYIALCQDSSPDDAVFLQLKQARRSVDARLVHGDSAWHAHQGQRVVEYQQALQTFTDPLLGWTTVGDHQYYVRQFRDMTGAVSVDGIDACALADYAGGHKVAVFIHHICGRQPTHRGLSLNNLSLRGSEDVHGRP